MKTRTEKIPLKVSEYVNNHFREDFLFEIKEMKSKGRLCYQVDVSKDNFEYKLLFNERGELLKEETENAFTPDPHEEPSAEDTPE